jgi:hypothetical protein
MRNWFLGVGALLTLAGIAASCGSGGNGTGGGASGGGTDGSSGGGTDGTGNGGSDGSGSGGAGSSRHDGGAQDVIVPYDTGHNGGGGARGFGGGGGTRGKGGSDGSGKGGSSGSSSSSGGSSGSGSGGFAGSSGTGGKGGSGGSGGSKEVNCYKITGTGDLQHCAFSDSDAPGFKCSDFGFMSGKCPATNLYGCCVKDGMDAGYTISGGACDYSATTGKPAKMACTGAGYTWVTTVP